MARTSNIYIRVEPDIKEQAEKVLEKLGIPMSNAVSIFLRQVVMQNGLPFEVKIPNTKPISLSNLSEVEFNMEMLKAHNDFENRRTYSFEEVENELKKRVRQMKYKIIFSENAKRDLISIVRYISEELLEPNIAENYRIEY